MDADGVFHNDSGLRAGWRIGIFVALFIGLTLAGQLTLSLLPPGPEEWLGLLVATAAALTAGVICITRLDGRPAGALGFPLRPAAARESLFGLIVGSLLIAAAVALLLLTGSAAFVAEAGGARSYLWTLGWQLAFFTLAAAVEELLFRGYPFQALVDGIGAWPATLLASAAFALAHAGNPNVTEIGLANIFLAGVLLSIAYLRTRSLWFATGVHVGWNWMMATVFDLPVSGLTRFDTPLYDAIETAPDWWSGGAFGPEAGLVGTLVLIGGMLWLLRSRRVTPAAYVRELRPLAVERLSEEPWLPATTH